MYKVSTSAFAYVAILPSVIIILLYESIICNLIYKVTKCTHKKIKLIANKIG